MNKFIILMTLILSSSLTWAFEPIQLNPSQIVSSFEHYFSLKKNENFRIHGQYSYNKEGEKQLFIYIKESHILTFESEQLVVIGRDTDDDDTIDTWFYQNSNGSVSFLQRALQNDLDFSTMKDVFVGIFDSDGRWAISILMKFAFQNLTLTGSEEYSFWANYENRQIYLIDLDLRLDRLIKNFPNDPTIKKLKQISADCWLSLFEDFAKHQGIDRYKMVGADVGLYIFGGLALKGVGIASKFAVHKLGLDNIIDTLAKVGEEHYRRLKLRVSNTHYHIRFGLPKHIDIKKTAGYGLLLKIAELPLMEKPATIIADLVLKSRLSRSFVKNYRFFVESLKEVNATRGYIAYNTSIQLGAEVLARGYVSVSDIPVVIDTPVKGVTDIVKKIGTDKDLLQNLAYMTVETANAAGISKVLQLKGVSLAKRFIICGFASTVNSIFMARVIKGEVNPIRNASDTAWEVLIGNSQTLFDIWQWQKWKELGHAMGIKQLKVVGVLITFAHQSVGYYTYSKWGDYLQENYPTKTDSQPLDDKLSDPIKLEPVLIPVLAYQ